MVFRQRRSGRGKRAELRNREKQRTGRLGIDGLLTSTQPDRDAQEGKRGDEEGESVLSDFELEGGARGAGRWWKRREGRAYLDDAGRGAPAGGEPDGLSDLELVSHCWLVC